mgnify:CR=1 FL=1
MFDYRSNREENENPVRNKIRTLAGEGRDGGLASAIRFCGKVSGGQHADAEGDICKTRPRGSAALPQVGAMRSDVPRRGRRGSFAGRAVYPLFRRPAPGAVRVQRGPRREGMSWDGRGTTGPSAPGVPPRGRAPPRRATPGHGQPCPEGHRNVPPRPMP